jgi:hypothetical protein
VAKVFEKHRSVLMTSRGLILISNDLASCSVEIVDPMVFTPVNTYPVLQKDKVFWEWESLLRELLVRLDLTSIRFIGCFRRGRAPTLLDCSPTLLILVDRNQDWTETREKVVSILKKWRLQMLAVEIVMDRPVYQADHKGISTGLVEGLLRNDTHHSLSRVYGHPQRLRRLLGHPILYMGDLQCGFGFVSTYDETIFLRQVQLASGQWIVKYSPVIYSTDAYEPSGSQGHGPGPSVSMRQCMFYVTMLPSAGHYRGCNRGSSAGARCHAKTQAQPYRSSSRS